MTWRMLSIISAWLTFSGFWIAASFIYKTRKPKRRDKKWFIFLICVILITVTTGYLAGEHLIKSFEYLPPFNYVINTVGIILLLSGLSFAIWARITLGHFWSGSVSLIENHIIVIKGPYAIVRHPIYTGVITMLWGSFLLEGIGLFLFTATLGTILLIWKARLEESLLEKYRGEEYAAYKMKVPAIL